MAEPKDLISPRKRYPNVLRFMENVTIEFLQALFATFPQGELHYDDDAIATDLKIEGKSTDNIETIDTRPKIVVGRGPLRWQNRGTLGGNFVGSKTLSMQQRQYADINDGTVGISCFARERLEAEDVAWICYDSIKSFRTVLQQAGFLTLHATQIGQPALIKKDARPELWVTPVLIKTEITSNWKVSISDPVVLKEIRIRLRETISDESGRIKQTY